MLRPRWRKVIRDLWQDKSRTGIVVSSIAVGVLAFGGLFATRSVVRTNIEFEYGLFNENDITVSVDGFDETLVNWTDRQRFVTGAQGITVQNVEVLLPSGAEDLVLTSFADLNDVRINRINPQVGSFPPARDEFVIERSYVDAIEVDLGSVVTVEVSDDRQESLRYVGTVHDINTFPNTIDPRIKGYVTQRTMDRLGLSTDFNQLYITVDRSGIEQARLDLNQVSDTLREDMERLGYQVRSVSVNQEAELWSADFANAVALILFVIGSAAVGLSGFLVVNVVSGLLARQRRQIGIMKMIGADSWQISGLYLVLVSCFGVLALIFAIPLSTLLARAVGGALLGPTFLNVNLDVFEFPTYVIVSQVIVAVGAPILAGLLPIVRSASVPPIESLREGADVSNDWFDRLLARLRGLPRPILLAIRNTFRRKIRLATTLIALVIAGGFFIGAINLRESVLLEAGSVPIAGSDVRLNLIQPYNLSGVERRVEGVSGVTDAEGWITDSVNRVRPDSSEGDSFTINGVPFDSPYNNPSIQAGRWLEPLTRENEYEIVIGSELEDVEPDVGVGDTLRINFNGTEQNWLVVGVVETGGPTSTTAPVFAHYETVSRFLGRPDQTNFVLFATETDSIVLDRSIELRAVDELERFGIGVATSSVTLEESENARSSFDVIIFLLAFVAILIAGVGGLGLGGTMSLNVLDRVREIGVMRSIGASSNTIRGMVLLEGLIIGLLSYLLALPFSMLVTYGFTVAIGAIFGSDPLAFGVNPIGLVLWIIIILVVASIASLAPAHRAAQISIREALAYE